MSGNVAPQRQKAPPPPPLVAALAHELTKSNYVKRPGKMQASTHFSKQGGAEAPLRLSKGEGDLLKPGKALFGQAFIYIPSLTLPSFWFYWLSWVLGL